jgi:surface protein
MSIADQITRLNNAKAAIKQSLTNKGVEVSDTALLDEYPTLIDSIEVGGGDDKSVWDIITNNGKRMEYLFYRCSDVLILDVSNWDTSQATNMQHMFYLCRNLMQVDVSNFNTGNVTNMNSMFYYCDTLTSLDVSNWDTSKVTNMNSMFKYCSNFTTLDLSNFNTGKVTDMSNMFSSCSKLAFLNISNWDMTKITASYSYSQMFSGCTALHTLRLDNCNNDTINKIITSSYFPTAAISGVTRTIYCKESEAAGLTAPKNWVFEYIDKVEEPPVEDIPLYVPGEFQENTEVTEVRTMVDESHDDLSYMFNGCTNLVSVNTENWDTSNVTDMTSMFQDCTSLTQLDLSNFNTAFVWSMSSMFWNCTSLTTLDLSNWETASIFDKSMDMFSMFDGCTSLHTLRLDNCSNDTIKKLIYSPAFPTNTIEGVTRTIYCKKSEAGGLTAPTNWVFSYVD